MLLRPVPRLILALLVVSAALAACSDDDGPTTPTTPPDTTPPQVIGTYPDPGDIGVSLDDSVYVLFNEAMDPDSADGNVILSAGPLTGWTWYSDRLLVLAHADWTTGTQVTVTVGTGLADAAGNTLAAAHAFSFWTETSELLLLSTLPADGATNVNRDAGIQLQFSQDVQTASLESHVTISDIVTKTVYPYSVSRLEDGRYLLDPVATLPANTLLYVTVAAGLQASGGATLAQTSVFDFTTGQDVDNTPPTIIAASPADGSNSVSPDVGFLSLTFSEPMDTDSVEPDTWNLELYLVFMTSGIPPFWNEDNTVLTVPLPSGLPAGLPMEITFVNFRDLAGNAQTTPYTWEARIQGNADYLPWVDGARYYEEKENAWGVVGDWTPLGSDTWTEFLQIDKVAASDWRFVQYDASFTAPSGNWDQYRKTGSALQWVGFEDVATKARRLMPASPDKELMFDQPLTILPLPISVRTWTSNTTVTVPGEGTYTAALQGQVLGKVDYPIPMSGGEVFLKDAWKVVRTMAISLDDTPAFTQTDTVWYSPTLGEVHSFSTEIDQMVDEWYTEDGWRLPAYLTKAALAERRRF